jgi:hypothetical protein
MTDSTPNSLIKIDTPVTARYGKKQVGIYIISGSMIVFLFDFISKHPHNMPLVSGCIITIFSIIGIVYKCARSQNSIYETELDVSFTAKNIVKKNEIYKFNPKNKIEKGIAWTGLEGVDTEGRLKFRKMKVYENKYCNRGMCWKVFPSDSKNPDAYYKEMENLYKSIPPFCLHKTTVAQSKHLVNLSAEYEKKLQNKNLPVIVRSGYNAKKKFFDEMKNRVGWMHIIFLGLDYVPNDQEAMEQIDEVRERYGGALGLNGVRVEPVTDPTDYAIICAQMSRMENLEGLI